MRNSEKPVQCPPTTKMSKVRAGCQVPWANPLLLRINRRYNRKITFYKGAILFWGEGVWIRSSATKHSVVKFGIASNAYLQNWLNLLCHSQLFTLQLSIPPLKNSLRPLTFRSFTLMLHYQPSTFQVVIWFHPILFVSLVI